MDTGSFTNVQDDKTDVILSETKNPEDSGTDTGSFTNVQDDKTDVIPTDQQGGGIP